MDGYFVHKEPIFDRKKAVFGQHVYFRDNISPQPGIEWAPARIDNGVIDAVTSEGGFETLFGNRRLFVDMSPEAMEATALGALPKGSVLKVSEKDAADKDMFAKSSMLKKQAYGIGVDYTPTGPGFLPFHQVTDFVEIDVNDVPVRELAGIVGLFKKLPLKLIATRVENAETFDAACAVGFDLFQGPFFLVPASETLESISSSQALLVQLSNDLRANKEIDLIEKAFKNSPKLTYGLLKLINSAFFGVSHKVSSIRQAIALLGFENLQKWVILLLFTIDNSDDGSNPLIEKAIIRGRVMEALAKKAGKRAMTDSAFITGMLSFINVLFRVSSDEITEKLNLTQDIQDALLNKQGILGRLLTIAERMDRQEYHIMGEELASMKLTATDVLTAETDATIDFQATMGQLLQAKTG
jgi:EAL and modified HD-GYP domain-containing signal transduction protein